MSSLMIAARPGDAAWAERVAAPFRAALGRDQVCVTYGPADRAGRTFVGAYERETRHGECRALLVIMGPAWQASLAQFADPDDPLRATLLEALKASAAIVIVLAEGVPRPREEQLPEALRVLARCSVVELSAASWSVALDAFVARFVPVVENRICASMARPPKAGPARSPGAQPETSEPPPSAPMPASRPVILGDDDRTLRDRLPRSIRNLTSEPEPGLIGKLKERMGAFAKNLAKRGGERPFSKESGRKRSLPAGIDVQDLLAPAQMAESAEGDLPAADAPEPASAGPTKPPEPVHLGASAPKAVKPGDEFTAHFVAYEKQLESEVRDLLKKLSPRAEPVLGVQECCWQPGTRVTVRLTGRDLTIDPAEQAFTWNGGRSLLEFDVAVPRDAPEGTRVLKFDVVIEGFVVARLRLDLEIEISARAGGGATATTTAQPAKSAFASYSSKDRLRVLDRLAAVKISAGIEVFLDCLDLHPGEEWKARLDREIRQRDLFLLFWSKNASQSKWVVWELETALKEKGEHALQLHPLDPDATPPPGLEELHASDVVMWVRMGYEASQSPSG